MNRHMVKMLHASALVVLQVSCFSPIVFVYFSWRGFSLSIRSILRNASRSKWTISQCHGTYLGLLYRDRLVWGICITTTMYWSHSLSTYNVQYLVSNSGRYRVEGTHKNNRVSVLCPEMRNPPRLNSGILWLLASVWGTFGMFHVSLAAYRCRYGLQILGYGWVSETLAWLISWLAAGWI